MALLLFELSDFAFVLFDEILILSLIFDLIGLFLKGIELILLLFRLIKLQSGFYLLQNLLYLFFLLLILPHEPQGFLVPFLILLYVRRLLQQFIKIEFVHENYLIDPALLQDIVGIRVGKP